MNPDELSRLIRQGENSGVEFKRDDLRPEQLAREADMDRARLTDYLGRVLADEVPPDEPAWSDRLCGLGFMAERADGPPVCTIAGVVLFAHRPRRVLRQTGLRWMAFCGDDMDYQSLDDTVLDAPLVGLWSIAGNGQVFRAQAGLIELFIDRTQPFLSEETAELVENLRRERRWTYPPDAVRECLLNAFAHRDWTRPAEVEVVRYRNRLTVTSPGALQNAMTIAKMLAGQRSARNPIIVEVLRDYGYVDARGMGVRRKIVPLVREYTGSEAVFEATDDFLRTTLPAKPAGQVKR
jgi:ATP-dependent DNA helicase RecG